jgi:thiol-disulfide isomerase/thioredoxin
MIPIGRRRVLLAMAGLLVAACTPGRKTGLQAGDPFPELALVDLDGRPQAYRPRHGRAALVNLWATWCEPCRREMPALDRLAQSPGGRGLDVLALSLDDDANLVKEFLLRYRLRLPVLLDPRQESTKHLLSGAVLPRSYLVAPDGHVVEVVERYRDWDSPEAQAAVVRLTG